MARTIYKGTSFEDGVKACAAVLVEADRQREESISKQQGQSLDADHSEGTDKVAASLERDTQQNQY